MRQEKELVERHNASLNEDLKSKTDRLIQVRKESEELEADLSSRLADVRLILPQLRFVMERTPLLLLLCQFPLLPPS